MAPGAPRSVDAAVGHVSCLRGGAVLRPAVTGGSVAGVVVPKPPRVQNPRRPRGAQAAGSRPQHLCFRKPAWGPGRCVSHGFQGLLVERVPHAGAATSFPWAFVAVGGVFVRILSLLLIV